MSKKKILILILIIIFISTGLILLISFFTNTSELKPVSSDNLEISSETKTDLVDNLGDNDFGTFEFTFSG